MAYLKWISNKVLEGHVTNMLNIAVNAKQSSKNQFGKNVIDPFAALFEISGFDKNYNDWVAGETERQAQKSLQNHVGEFHQNILGSCAGWSDLKTGKQVDLLNTGKKIIAEIKNKHNTTSGKDLAKAYDRLHALVMLNASIYKGYTSYYVTIIPKNKTRFDIEFEPSDNETKTKRQKNKLIKIIDGASFYEMVTGDANALEDLFDVLPKVILSVQPKLKLDVAKLKALFKQAYV